MSKQRSEVWKQLSKVLVSLDTKDKDFSGRHYSDQLKLGRDLFQNFCSLGLQLQASKQSVSGSLASDVFKSVTSHQFWLQSFVSIYGSTQIDLEGAVPTLEICQIRSGVQFLLEDFKDLNKDFDIVLDNLKVYGEVDDFDNNLRIWIEGGFRDNLRPEQIDPNVPEDHWWWF